MKQEILEKNASEKDHLSAYLQIILKEISKINSQSKCVVHRDTKDLLISCQ